MSWVRRVGPFELHYVPTIGGRLYNLGGRYNCWRGRHFWVGGGSDLHWNVKCGRKDCAASFVGTREVFHLHLQGGGRLDKRPARSP